MPTIAFAMPIVPGGGGAAGIAGIRASRERGHAAGCHPRRLRLEPGFGLTYDPAPTRAQAANSR